MDPHPLTDYGLNHIVAGRNFSQEPLALARMWSQHCWLCSRHPKDCRLATRAHCHHTEINIACWIRDSFEEDFEGFAKILLDFLGNRVRVSNGSGYGFIERSSFGLDDWGMRLCPRSIREERCEPRQMLAWERRRELCLTFLHELCHLPFFPEFWTKTSGAEKLRARLTHFHCERAVEGIALAILSGREAQAEALLRRTLGEEMWLKATRMLDGRLI